MMSHAVVVRPPRGLGISRFHHRGVCVDEKINSYVDRSDRLCHYARMKPASNSRLVVIAAALMLCVTLYSLSELHKISAAHTALDRRRGFETTVRDSTESNRSPDTAGLLLACMQASIEF